MSNDIHEQYRQLFRKAMNVCGTYPVSKYSGRGVVTCAGGPTYFLSAWVMINMLRRSGCTLPIESWFLGTQEIDEEMIELLRPLGVTCVDAYEVMRTFPVRQVPEREGWQLKPYAIIHSAFREIIFIDADNVPLVDPSCFFDCLPYQNTGALFWPDREPLPRGWQNLPAEENMWNVCEVEFRIEPSFETGQIVIDKERCWKALQLTMHFNEHSDFYYRLIWGDPETFHFAWLLQEQAYGMIPHPVIDKDGLALFQKDLSGAVVFQHRNGDKWRWDGHNKPIPGFDREGDCRALILELRNRLLVNRGV